MYQSPTISDMPVGTFVADFRMKVGARVNNASVAAIDVYNVASNTVIASRTLNHGDFNCGVPNDFRSLMLTFTTPPNAQLRFRVHYHDRTDISVDKVRIGAPSIELKGNTHFLGLNGEAYGFMQINPHTGVLRNIRLSAEGNVDLPYPRAVISH